MPRTRVALALIVALALATRVAYYDSNTQPNFGQWWWGWMAHFIVDDGHWFQTNDNARYVVFNSPALINYPLIEPADLNLKNADENPRWTPFVAEPVGEAVVLAALWKLTGSERFLPDAILRILLSAFAALLVYRIAMRLFRRRRAALLGAGLYAAYPPLAWVASSPLLDAWGVNFTLAILAAYLEAINSLHHRRRWLIACGLLAGLGGYFRPGVLLLPAALALATIAETGWRGALRRGVAVSAIAAVLLVPWTIRNYEDFHTFVAVRTGNGQTLWQGLGEVPNTFGAFSSDWFTYYQVRAAHPHYRYQSPAYDSYLQQQAIKAIKQHPLFYLKLVARRAVISTLWTFNPEWMHRGVKSPQTYGHGLIAYLRDRPLDLFQVALQPLVFILAMLTLGLTWRRRRDAHAILLATVVSVIAPYIVFYFEFRYALPAAFAYLILIGFGADLLIERAGLWRAERRPQSAVVASSRS